MDGPLVSIITPTYNRGELLRQAIASARAQQYDRWELLIIDDGSTDGSVDHLPIDGRIRILRRAHTGHVGRVRQAGLEAAAGAFIGFLDSDDQWFPDKLLRQLARLAECPEAGWCFGDYQLVNGLRAQVPIRGVPTTMREGTLFDAFIRREAGISIQTILVRRDVALSVGFDSRIPLCEDLDFMIRLSQLAPACRVPGTIAEMREHAGRSTRHRSDQHVALARAFWRYQRLTPDPELRRACRRRAYDHARSFLAHTRASVSVLASRKR